MVIGVLAQVPCGRLTLQDIFSGLPTVALKVILLQPTKRAEDVASSHLLHHPAVVNGDQVQFPEGQSALAVKLPDHRPAFMALKKSLSSAPNVGGSNGSMACLVVAFAVKLGISRTG